MNATFAVLLGLFVRLIVPLVVTGLIVLWLHRLDKRWQAEAEKERNMLARDNLPCWLDQGLSMADAKLQAAKSDQPCWQTHRSLNGYLREACLDCEVFRSAPTPAPDSKISHAHV